MHVLGPRPPTVILFFWGHVQTTRKAWLQDLRSAGYDLLDLTGQAEVHAAPMSQEQVPSSPSLTVTEPTSDSRPHVMLVIAVVSARPERRDAIRKSWIAWGDERVEVRFFTEQSVSGSSEQAALEAESAAHGDLVLMDIDPGMNFALKLVWAMRWMSRKFTFDFFLRLDDDYFLCLGRLLDELDATLSIAESPSTIYAGHMHCKHSATRIDEAYLLLSAELVRRAVVTPDLKCSNHAGVSAGWWFTEGNVLNQHGDVEWVNDPRLDADGKYLGRPPEPFFADTCLTHMGVHHAYPSKMLQVWESAKDKPGPAAGKTADDGSSLFRYIDDGACKMPGAGISNSTFFGSDNAQPCDTFITKSHEIHCGGEGC